MLICVTCLVFYYIFNAKSFAVSKITPSMPQSVAIVWQLLCGTVSLFSPTPRGGIRIGGSLFSNRNGLHNHFCPACVALSMAQMARRGHADSFTAHDSQPRATGAAPSGATAQPGNRFSEILTSFPPPPPPLTTLPSNSHAPSSFSSTTTAGAGEGAEMASAGSLGRRKAVPPAPPMRTTTLRVDEHLGRLQVRVLFLVFCPFFVVSYLGSNSSWLKFPSSNNPQKKWL